MKITVDTLTDSVVMRECIERWCVCGKFSVAMSGRTRVGRPLTCEFGSQDRRRPIAPPVRDATGVWRLVVSYKLSVDPKQSLDGGPPTAVDTWQTGMVVCGWTVGCCCCCCWFSLGPANVPGIRNLRRQRLRTSSETGSNAARYATLSFVTWYLSLGIQCREEGSQTRQTERRRYNLTVTLMMLLQT